MVIRNINYFYVQIMKLRKKVKINIMVCFLFPDNSSQSADKACVCTTSSLCFWYNESAFSRSDHGQPCCNESAFSRSDYRVSPGAMSQHFPDLITVSPGAMSQHFPDLITGSALALSALFLLIQ